ncbi:ABC transporter substrate-binding protein [Halovenus salina]|uniref:ABC transporter substrate-binding protein n=1 Tax=Halovenus salina TaxID=1510225 RepID=UPI002260F3A8|nr:ABC transporter substrate-binding protein [Halovenus salina]
MTGQQRNQQLHRRGFLAAIGGTVALAGCLSGTGDDSSESRLPLTERTLRYGAVLPQSGALEAAGQVLINGAALPAKELEDAGIPAEVEFQTRDSETTPTGAIDAAQSLIEDGFPAIVGAAASGGTLQMAQQATIPAEVVSCSPSATTPTLSILSDRGYSFRTAPVDSLQAVIVAQLATAEHDASSAATLYAQGDYGRQLSGAFSASFDGEILAQQSYSPESDSYRGVLDTVLDGDPDVLFAVGYPEGGIPLLETYYEEYENDEVLFISDGLIDGTVQESVDFHDAVYGVVPASVGPGQERFVSMYNEEYGTEPGLFGSNTYDAAATILLANAAAGENDGAAIARQMREVTVAGGTEIQPGELADGIERAGAGEKVHYRGAAGEIEFDENGDGGPVQYEYLTFTDSGREILDQLTPPEGSA